MAEAQTECDKERAVLKAMQARIDQQGQEITHLRSLLTSVGVLAASIHPPQPPWGA